jgi:autotransporter-associated beta strand protein
MLPNWLRRVFSPRSPAIRRKGRAPVNLARPCLEALEDRLAPALHIWTGAVNGLWSNGGNWIGGSPVGDSAAQLQFDTNGLARQLSIDDIAGDLPLQSICFAVGGYTVLSFGGELNFGAPYTTDVINNSGSNYLGVTTVGSYTGVDPQKALQFQVASGSTLTVGGSISTDINVRESGGGTLVLGGNNTFDGSNGLRFDVTSGTLRVTNANAITNKVHLYVNNGTTFDANGLAVHVQTLNGSGAVTLGSSGKLIVGERNDSCTFSGSITSTSGAQTENLRKEGLGQLTLNGSSTYNGITTVNAGTLLIGSYYGVSPHSTVVVNSGATLDVASWFPVIGNLAGSGNVVLDPRFGTPYLSVGGNNTSTVFSGNISGSGELWKDGTGTLTLSGHNTYNGGTDVHGGTLRLGSTYAQHGNYTGVNAGATLDVEAWEPVIGDLWGAGNIVLGNRLWLYGLDNQVFSGQISGSGDLVEWGSGTLTLSGNNIYTGKTEVHGGGTLRVGSANALGNTSGASLSDAGSTLDLNGFAVSVPSLTGNAGTRVLLGSGTLTEGSANLNDIIAGDISGTGGITKVGTGTLTLSGHNYNFFGTTHVVGGTLLVSGGAGRVSLDAGTTLSGTGYTLDVSAAGTVSPGTAAATGVLHTWGGLALDHGTLRVRLNGPNPGSGYDRVEAWGGVVSLRGTAALNVTAGYTSPIGTTFTILASYYDPTSIGVSYIDGTFAGLPNGALLNASGQLFRINYTYDAFGDEFVTLTHVATPTATTLSADVNPVAFGRPVTLTATVSVPAPGTASPAGGTVTFFDGATALGTATVAANGRATFTTSALGVGAHSLTATLAAAGELAASTSAAWAEAVTQATTTTLSADVSPSVVGQSVTLTAVVSGAAGTPTGTVTFFDGFRGLGTITLDANGRATLTTAFASAGTHSLTAVYNGDASSSASTSAALAQAVSPAATAASLSADLNPVDFGVPVTLTATVSVTGPGAGTPTGTVTFLEGDTVLGTATLDANGQAALVLDSLASGTHLITVSYGSDGNFQDSLSDPLTLVVN